MTPAPDNARDGDPGHHTALSRQIDDIADAVRQALGLAFSSPAHAAIAPGDTWSAENLLPSDVNVLSLPPEVLSASRRRKRDAPVLRNALKRAIVGDSRQSNASHQRSLPTSLDLLTNNAELVKRAVFLPNFVAILNDGQYSGTTLEPSRWGEIPTSLLPQVKSNPFWWLDCTEEDGGQIIYANVSRGSRSGRHSLFCLEWWTFCYLARAATERHPLYTGHYQRECQCFGSNDSDPPTHPSPADDLVCGRAVYPDFAIRFTRPKDDFVTSDYEMWVRGSQDVLIRLQCHIRYFKPSLKTWESEKRKSGETDRYSGRWNFRFNLPVEVERRGIELKRQVAKLKSRGASEYISESAVSLSLHSRSTALGCRWGRTILSDDDLWPEGFEELARTVGDTRTWAELGEPAAPRAPDLPAPRRGETVFQSIILLTFLKVEEEWGQTLGLIRSIAGIMLDDFLDEEKIKDLMFDRTFERSQDYFTALQLLRLVDEWIEHNLDEIRGLFESQKIRTMYMEGPWVWYVEKDLLDATMRVLEHRSRQLHEKVSKLREDITSLRDGLFNATSLREATRGTSLNTAIYLFTIVTILYTPIGFLATFWALSWLSSPSDPDDRVTQPGAFLVTMIVVPIATYFIVAAFAWYFWPTGSNHLRVAAWFRTFRATCKALLGVPMNLFPSR